MTALSHTTSHCPDCQESHAARYERVGSDVDFVVDCPLGNPRYRVSSDAELFSHFRAKAGFDFGAPYPFSGYRHVNLFEITNQCDYACSFCYSSARGETTATHLPVTEILEMGRRVASEGCYAITVTGGEPTLHPDIISVVRQLKAMGLVVTMPTNGLRLAREPRLAVSLARAGLDTVALQFDTFDPQVQKRHRNNELVAEKQLAVEACHRAGLKLLLLPTVTRHNLAELGTLIEYGLSHRPSVYGLTMQGYYEDARSSLPTDLRVTKEDIVHAVVDSAVVPQLTAHDFWPLPQFYGLRIAVHPDCGVIAPLFIENGRVRPATQLVDMAGLYQRLARVEKPLGFHAGLALLGYYGLQAAQGSAGARLVAAMTAMARGRLDSGLFFLVVESFMSGPHQDDDRARRCATVTRASNGINQHGCYANRLWHSAPSTPQGES